MSKIINFYNRKKRSTIDAGQSKAAVVKSFSSKGLVSFEFTIDDLNNLTDALLYYSGYVGDQADTATATKDKEIAIRRKSYLTKLSLHIQEKSKNFNSPITLSLNNDDIGCISESLLYYSGFIGEQTNTVESKLEKENIWSKKSTLIQLYTKISEYYSLE